MTSSGPGLPRPLVVSSDEALTDDLLRLLAAAGATPELATGGGALRRAHRGAPLVLLGADVLAVPAVRALPRRPGVVVVATAELPGAGYEAAVAVGAERVVVLPRDENWLVERAATAVCEPVDPGPLVVVTGSCGGVGASTVATALALGLVGGRAPVLLDADARGGGLDLLLGAEWADGLRWPELTSVRGRLAGGSVVPALPEAHGVHVLAASRRTPVELPGEALAAVTAAARRDGHPVVVDLPRRACPGELADAVLPDADLAVVLVPDRVRGAAAAAALLGAGDPAAGGPWPAAATATRLVLRTGPAGLSAAEVAAVVGHPVAAALGHDRSVLARGERGEPPLVGARTPLGQLGRVLLAGLAAPARSARA